MLLVVAVMFVASVFSAVAADFEVDGISYNVIGENEVEVTRSSSSGYIGEVIIPSTVVNDGTTYQVTRIGNSAFSGYSELYIVGIPEGVTSIGNSAFSGCTQLDNIDLPNSLVSIGTLAFWNCNSFTQFHVPRNLTDIAYNAFMTCYNIEYFSCSTLNPRFKAVNGVLYSKDLTMLRNYPPGATDTSFVIPSTVTALYDYCFSFNQHLVNVTIPETVTWMGMNIFNGCKGIVEIDIPDGVTHMGVTVFGNCSNLIRVHLPASLDTIKSSTFLNCEKLAEVTVPRNVSCIDQLSFAYAPAIKKINFEEGSRLKSIGNQAFRECNALEYFEMPNSVDSVANSSFYECESLKSIRMGENLRVLDRSAIGHCNSLVECIIPSNIPVINMPFIHCPELKRVTIGSKDGTPGSTLIKSYIFFSCDNVDYIELGANVDSLENSAFATLSDFKVMKCWAVDPPRCNNIFNTFPQNARLYVPKASLEAYRTANGWNRFNTILPIEDVGDVDGNGSLGIGDVTELIDQILIGEVANPALADVDLDGKVGISDVTELIDKVLGGY